MKSVIPFDWEVPEVFRNRLGEAAGRQRAMSADGHLFLILHQPPSPTSERNARFFWRDAAGEWRSNNLGNGVQSLRKHVQEFGERTEEFEKQWQGARSAEDYFVLLQAIAPLHRSARNLHAALQQAREMLPDERDLLNLRDQAGEIERNLELLHGDARNGLDFTIAHQTEQQAQKSYEMAVSAHRLNLLAAVFFPVATVSAIFGMNLSHGVDPSNQMVFFWGLLVIGLLGGVLLAGLVSRRPKPVTAPVVKARGKRIGPRQPR